MMSPTIATTYPFPVSVVHDFPTATWIENLAVRSNGQILATEDTPHPRVYQVDPFGFKEAIVVHEFTDTASVLGIVETQPDIFYICTANYSSALLEGYGQAYIYQIDMRDFNPGSPESVRVAKVAEVETDGALDGLTYLGDESGLLLVSDFLKGVIWSVDIHTGNVALAINDTLTQSTYFGVNGLKVRANDLYFTNTQKQILAKVPINSKGQRAGDLTILAKGGFDPDDFAMDVGGDSYVTSYTLGSQGIVFVPREGGVATQIAGVRGPTACAFGRTAADCQSLYVSTSGGDRAYSSGGEVAVSGKILRIDVGRLGTRHCKND